MNDNFTCQKCGRRLPVVRLAGEATIICRYCKERTPIEAQPAPSFRDKVQQKFVEQTRETLKPEYEAALKRLSNA